MDSTIIKVQKYSLELMHVFHNVCEENNLTYYMIGGTLLGAVRHNGFIPWDDDIDIAMPRKDYEFLLENSDKIFDSRYKMNHYSNCDISSVVRSMTVKFSDLNIDIYIERNGKHEHTKASIDVFPIDGTPDNTILRKIHFFKLLFLRALYKFTFSDKLEIDPGTKRSFIERFLIRFAKITRIGKLINGKKVVAALKKNLCKYSCESSKCMSGTFLGVYKLREFVDSKYFTSRKKYKFEDGEFWGTEFADGYLTSIYGDYMQLPPEEKRVSKHKIVRIEAE